MGNIDACVRFMIMLRVLVNDTRKDEPMTRQEIMRRCKENGAEITEFSFSKNIKRMEQAGIYIRHNTESTRTGTRNLYWYDEGWI